MPIQSNIIFYFFCYLSMVFLSATQYTGQKDKWLFGIYMGRLKMNIRAKLSISWQVETARTGTHYCWSIVWNVKAYKNGSAFTAYQIDVGSNCRNSTVITLKQLNCSKPLLLQGVGFTNLENKKAYKINCQPKCFGNCTANGTTKIKRYDIRSTSCKPNYFGIKKCDKKCHCRNDANCSEYSGYCKGDCERGYMGRDCQTVCPKTKFGINCRSTCGKCAKTRCNSMTGKCSDGCQIGHTGDWCKPCTNSTYGVNCTESCHCYGNYPCNIMTGSCGRYGCAFFWKGKDVCNESTVCTDGFFGKLCVPCGQCMDGHCDPYTGHCPSSRCKPNFFGSRCDVCATNMHGLKCDKRCGHCLHSEPCNSFTGVCPHSLCDPGYSGNYCELECGKGHYGPNCFLHCKTCAERECSPTSGSCINGCTPGWKGQFCNVSDSHIDCPPGFYGVDCAAKCGHCAKTKTCNLNSGKCPSGCIGKYQGPRCVECPDGFYGENCAELCGNCIDGNKCETNGKCTNGCLNRFLEPNCSECASGFFGPLCDQSCGQCRSQDVCDSHSGACPNGCADGFTGHYCKQRVHQNLVFDNF